MARFNSFKFLLLTYLGLMTNTVSGRTLEELLQQAMQTYPTILAKQAAQQAAQTELTAAKLRFLPSPSISTQRNQITYSGQEAVRQPSTSVVIHQPLFLDGGVVAGYNKADAKLSASDYAILESREEVSKRLINVYGEWLKAYLKIEALEETVRLHERFVEMISRRSEAGVASGADRDLGVSRLMLAKSDLDAQRLQERTALTSLGELIGEPVRRSDLNSSIAKPLPLPHRQDGMTQATLISPMIHRLNFEATAAEEEAREVRAQALPQVAFQAQRQIGNAVIPGSSSYNMYGVVLNYIPGGGFSTIATTSAAYKRAEASRIQVEAAKRELSDRLNADYNEYEFAGRRKEMMQNSAKLTSDIAASYDRQYLVGRKSWLDLMNSVREQTQNKMQLADIDASLLVTSRKLFVYIEGTHLFDTVDRSSTVPVSKKNK